MWVEFDRSPLCFPLSYKNQSPNVKKSGIRDLANVRLWNPESRAWNPEYIVWDPESTDFNGINLT